MYVPTPALTLVHPVYIGVVKRNPLFFHSISCKNNGFLFTTSNIYICVYIYIYIYIYIYTGCLETNDKSFAEDRFTEYTKLIRKILYNFMILVIVNKMLIAKNCQKLVFNNLFT